MKKIHFVDGFFRRPFFKSHAVGGNENAGAIIPQPAVQKDFFPGPFGHQRKELGHLLVGRRRPPAGADELEVHAQGFGALALPFTLAQIFTAQIQDGGDAEFLEFRETFLARLGAAIEPLADFAEFRNAGDVDFFGIRQPASRRIAVNGVMAAGGKNERGTD